MRLAGHFYTLLVALILLFSGLDQSASAQFFKARNPPMKKASELIRRQKGPEINRRLESVINPGNSHARISLSKQRLYLMVGDDVYIDTPISSGKRAGMTPTGTFKVLEKDADHRSSVYGDFVDRNGRTVRSGISTKVDSAPSGTKYRGAPMKWFCRLTWSGVGFHTGILPGYPASHGCIRLPADIAPLIYQKVKIGTVAVIVP
jgi:lipoprotein-anchoring transpeptidase ErfK/SrfK